MEWPCCQEVNARRVDFRPRVCYTGEFFVELLSKQIARRVVTSIAQCVTLP